MQKQSLILVCLGLWLLLNGNDTPSSPIHLWNEIRNPVSFSFEFSESRHVIGLFDNKYTFIPTEGSWPWKELINISLSRGKLECWEANMEAYQKSLKNPFLMFSGSPLIPSWKCGCLYYLLLHDLGMWIMRREVLNPLILPHSCLPFFCHFHTEILETFFCSQMVK